MALDSNLLLLLVVGETDLRLIERHRRLRAYDLDSYRLIAEMVVDASRILVTPNVLTEVSNLGCYGISEPGCSQIRATLRMLVKQAGEVYLPSSDAMGAHEFQRLGLTDATFLQIQWPEDCTLWTDDLDLWLAANARGVKVQRLLDMRQERGLL
ncbi:MAG: hypothetical protein K0U74_08795 [Alphaproteobacteria bacterium]|nr:hypothetical protein [Alphaproteobacteria bacterium]